MATSSLLPVVTRPTSATTSAVVQTTSSVTLLAANSDRLGALIQNQGTRILYVKAGPGASTSDYSVALLPLQVVELPFPVFTGDVTGTWAGSGSGTARVTELF